MIPVLLIFTLYVLVYNLAIYLPARLFGVRVEKFYIWLDVWISFIRIDINNTDFGLGWLPLGGYVKLSGMYLEEHEEIRPYYFKRVSLLKQFIIVFGGPLICLIIGALIYLINIDNESEDFTNNALILVALVSCFILILIAVFTFKRNANVINKKFKWIFFIGTFTFYLIFLLAFAFCMNELIPFFSDLSDLLIGNIKFRDFQLNLGGLQSITAFIGVWFFFFNLLPLGGLNGFTIVEILHEAFTGIKLPNSYIDKMSLISFPLNLLIYGWIIFVLFI